MIFIGLPFLKKESTRYYASDPQHHKCTRYEYVLPSKHSLSCQVNESVALPVRGVIIIFDYDSVLACLKILFNTPP